MISQLPEHLSRKQGGLSALKPTTDFSAVPEEFIIILLPDKKREVFSCGSGQLLGPPAISITQHVRAKIPLTAPEYLYAFLSV